MHVQAAGSALCSMTTHAINIHAAGRPCNAAAKPAGCPWPPVPALHHQWGPTPPVQQLTSEAFSCTLTFCQSQKTLSSGISVKNCLQREQEIDTAFVAYERKWYTLEVCTAITLL